MNQQPLQSNFDTAEHPTKTAFEQLLDHLQYPPSQDPAERRLKESMEHELLDELDMLEIETHLMQYASEIEALAEKIKLTHLIEAKKSIRELFQYRDRRQKSDLRFKWGYLSASARFHKQSIDISFSTRLPRDIDGAKRVFVKRRIRPGAKGFTRRAIISAFRQSGFKTAPEEDLRLGHLLTGRFNNIMSENKFTTLISRNARYLRERLEKRYGDVLNYSEGEIYQTE